ncbi:flagellar hook assembly protein FlgD [Paenibacillus cremeus]|uniref:Flagellar hook assembly protein FlgD n=1 Tax=Paenibacillus cremeus TaxID=2163881 RepID=A0A559KEV2_9BACL|nr:flagellar hook assembly protein FlgD [Paenibacillus cremeus]TVY10652.1 flagellar hook assembly protein FlgD [Paenibacillus cremeus]
MTDSAISTKNIWPNYSSTNTQSTTSSSSNLGKDEFLKILITQLKNQDPTQPLQDKEFIAQMAQFTSVEQLTNMNTEMKLMRQSLGIASGLIGKNVTWTAVDSTGASTVKSGIVDSIILKAGQQYVKVGSEDIALDSISQISNPEAAK